MTYEEKKKLIEAAKKLKEYCKETFMKGECSSCVMNIGIINDCKLNKERPMHWTIPTLSRWTPEDVALAKALKGFGAESIKRNPNIGIYWIKENPFGAGYLPNNSFANLGYDEKISIDTIIKEEERLK